MRHTIVTSHPWYEKEDGAKPSTNQMLFCSSDEEDNKPQHANGISISSSKNVKISLENT